MIKRFENISEDFKDHNFIKSLLKSDEDKNFEIDDVVYYYGHIKKVFGEEATILRKSKIYEDGWKIAFSNPKFGSLVVKGDEITRSKKENNWWDIDESANTKIYEEWFVKKQIFQIGDKVMVNGTVDRKDFKDVEDTIVDMCKTTLDIGYENYTGDCYLLKNSNWWVSPYNLKKVEVKRSFSRIDPYGEENWEA